MNGSRAAVLVQCAPLDKDDNVRGCPVVCQLTGGPKRLIWYDDDHHFTSLEALRDRLLGTHIPDFLKR
jgi:hypothetical protein